MARHEELRIKCNGEQFERFKIAVLKSRCSQAEFLDRLMDLYEERIKSWNPEMTYK